jgi:hypothetical protein
VNLIANTRTTTGLEVRCVLDTNRYPKGVKLTAKQMARVNLVPDKFHGDWNYAVHPNRSR